MYYAYLLRCADDTLYAGYTDDLSKRVTVHNQGKGAKYTRSRLPVSLVYFLASGVFLVSSRSCNRRYCCQYFRRCSHCHSRSHCRRGAAG